MNKYCKGQDGHCLNLIQTLDIICMWCQGYHKIPLGPKDKPFLKFRWEK